MTNILHQIDVGTVGVMASMHDEEHNRFSIMLLMCSLGAKATHYTDGEFAVSITPKKRFLS